MSSRPGPLDRIEAYFAAAPVPDTTVERIGALDVPIGPAEWPYPARPHPGVGPVPAVDVQAALDRQAQAGLPASLEWFAVRNPGLAQTVRAAGLVVDELPLLVAVDPVEVTLPPEVRLYLVGADDPLLATYQRLAQLAFDNPGPAAAAAGAAGATALGDEASGRGTELPAPTAVLRERVAAGRTVMMIAVEHGETVAVGSHQPVAVGGADGRVDDVSEVVGIATMPRFRGRGLGAGLASALVEHARETADLVFLTAGDDDVARVYERVGFAQVGTTLVGERPAGWAGGSRR